MFLMLLILSFNTGFLFFSSFFLLLNGYLYLRCNEYFITACYACLSQCHTKHFFLHLYTRRYNVSYMGQINDLKVTNGTDKA